jgi:hypothetical protein
VKMKQALFCVLFIATCAFAQTFQGSYMTYPYGRFAGAATSSQTAPCGEGNDTIINPITVGVQFSVQWIKNNINSNNLVYVLLLNYPGMGIYRSLGNFTFNSLSGNVRIPYDVPAGMYYLQWVYSTYYTCALLNVSASTMDVRTLIVTQSVTRDVPIDSYQYYEVNAGTQYNNNFLEFYGTGPNGAQTGAFITVVGRETPNFAQYPTKQLYDNIADTSATDNFYFSLCRDNNNEDDFVVGVIGSASVTAGTQYTLNVGYYGPTVNANQALNSASHNGKKYFLTQAYTTETAKRRFVVNYNIDFTDIPQVRLATNCAFTANLKTGVSTTTKSVCIDLPTNQGNKFVEIPPTTDSYVVQVETGSCQEVTGTSSTFVASLALIASLVFALLM